VSALIVAITTVVFNWGSQTIFRRVASRYFKQTAVLHLLYSSCGWGLVSYSGLLAIMGHSTK